jgi:molybdenum cofactor synthesis domain-containing protein
VSAAGVVAAVCVSAERGPKRAVERVTLVAGHGVEGDVHAGSWHRQLSLLEEEQIDLLRGRGVELPPGAFGENIVTRGLALGPLVVGRRLRVGPAVLQITQRGKECHTRCPIYFQTGDCLMPREGLFARVRRGGELRPGDAVATDAALDRVRFAVLTLSDRGAAGERDDASGALACELLAGALGGPELARGLLPDEQPAIERELRRLADEEVCDLIVTTGGTGLSPRDVTPEATRAVIDREVPGVAEAMRAAGLAKTPRAMLSRGLCGLRGSTLIVNLSGSPRAVREQLEAILPALPHAVEVASGVPQDCARR